MKYLTILLLLLMQESITIPCFGTSAPDNKVSKFCPLDMLASTTSPSSTQVECYSVTHASTGKELARTASGIPYPSLTASLGIGTRGPVLLQDVFLIETLQSMNRERIPERVVHAKGAGAKGVFTVTRDVRKYTKAAFLRRIGQKTKVAVRFSTVAGESGSADTLFDTKGFALKFYTHDGIFDLVGNAIQVFQIRDPTLFPSLNRVRKRNPQTHLRDPTAIWDFLSLRPEATLNTLYLYSETSQPTSLSYLDGFGIHTFKMVNDDNHAVYVKFHWLSNDKHKKYFTVNETIEMAGKNPDFLTQDLFDRIERKDYPEWNMYIQVMTFEQAAKHPQNPFDVTKFWKPKEYPLMLVGTMTLNENPTDYFTQVEQLAFSPSHMVPGIEASPDRMLHARMFAYPDAQVYRLGINFAQIPINSCPFHVNTYLRDGHMNVGTNGAGAPNYYPNSFNGLRTAEGNYFKGKAFFVSGDVDRFDTGDDDNFSLPKYYLEHYVTKEGRKIIVENMAGQLAKAAKYVQRNYINFVAYKISKRFGNDLRKALNL